MTLKMGLMGTGRMAHVYGPKILQSDQMELTAIFNPRRASAQKAALQYGGEAHYELERFLDNVNAVIIATPTNTHVDYIREVAKMGKPIYCEKPLDQTLGRVDEALAILDAHPVPFMMGFNRRFDPDNAAVKKAVKAGEVGKLNMMMSTSREPAPPPIDYVLVSGGYFVDASIHDIDLLCWIAGEWPEEVMASGSCMFDEAIGGVGDFDLTMSTLKMPSGALVHINNSRSCAYGFDQRLEVFGTKGMLQTRNHRDDNLVRWDERCTEACAPLQHFFLERYDASFGNALEAFARALRGNKPMPATAEEGRRALAVALACTQSAKEGRAIKPNY